MNEYTYHIPVLLEEVLAHLHVVEKGKYIDGTFGFGGHSKKILALGGVVLGIDVDTDSLDEAQKEFGKDKDLKLVNGNFRDIARIAHENGFKKVNEYFS